MNEAERAALAAELEKLTGKRIRMTFAVDRSLIGGVVAKVGSTLYDGSVRGSLESLERRLSAEKAKWEGFMAQIRADEITSILRQEIENYDKAMDVSETGSVISVGDGIARVHGLERVMSGELISFPHGVSGIAMNLEEDQVGAVLLGEYTEIKEGDEVKRTGRIMSVPVGKAMIGRVVERARACRSTAKAPSITMATTPSSASRPAWSIVNR